MDLSLPAGEYHLVLDTLPDLSERLGAWQSLVCLILVMVIAITGVPFVGPGAAVSDDSMASERPGHRALESAMHHAR
jgi:hypothetical protein